MLTDFFDYVVPSEGTDVAVGVDIYDFCETGQIGRTITCAGGGLNEHIPCVREPVIAATTGSFMTNSVEIAETLMARDYKDPQIVCIGFDGYNAALTGEVTSSLGTNCGMSTGRQGVIVDESELLTPIGFDGYNQAATGDLSKAITSAATDSDHVPLVFTDEY